MLATLLPLVPALALAFSLLCFLMNGGWTILNLRMENRQTAKLDEFRNVQTGKLDEFKLWIEGRLDKMQREIEQEQYKLERRVERLERQAHFALGAEVA